MSHHFDYQRRSKTSPTSVLRRAQRRRRPAHGNRDECLAAGPPQIQNDHRIPVGSRDRSERDLYELKLDLNDDFVEDITWRFTFPGPTPPAPSTCKWRS